MLEVLTSMFNLQSSTFSELENLTCLISKAHSCVSNAYENQMEGSPQNGEL